MGLKETFFGEKVKTYILVKEGRSQGIETFMDKDIEKFNRAYKRQLISFLINVVKILKRSEKYDEPREKWER